MEIGPNSVLTRTLGIEVDASTVDIYSKFLNVLVEHPNVNANMRDGWTVQRLVSRAVQIQRRFAELGPHSATIIVSLVRILEKLEPTYIRPKPLNLLLGPEYDPRFAGEYYRCVARIVIAHKPQFLDLAVQRLVEQIVTPGELPICDLVETAKQVFDYGPIAHGDTRSILEQKLAADGEATDLPVRRMCRILLDRPDEPEWPHD